MSLDRANQREAILAGFEPLFAEAAATGKWFHCAYQDLWFHPDQLRKEHRAGRFIWGVSNWRLRDPSERVKEAEGAVARAEAELKRVRGEVGP